MMRVDDFLSVACVAADMRGRWLFHARVCRVTRVCPALRRECFGSGRGGDGEFRVICPAAP